MAGAWKSARTVLPLQVQDVPIRDRPPSLWLQASQPELCVNTAIRAADRCAFTEIQQRQLADGLTGPAHEERCDRVKPSVFLEGLAFHLPNRLSGLATNAAETSSPWKC